MVADLKLTKTERKMMDLLSDGLPHGEAELRRCINEELACDSAPRVHIFNLRQKLLEVGLNVVSVRGEYMLMQRLQRPE